MVFGGDFLTARAVVVAVVPKAGLEPAWGFPHCPLKTACLPVPPLRHEVSFGALFRNSRHIIARAGSILRRDRRHIRRKIRQRRRRDHA